MQIAYRNNRRAIVGAKNVVPLTLPAHLYGRTGINSHFTQNNAKMPPSDCFKKSWGVRCVIKRPILERAAVTAGPLNQVANDRQLTPSQKTVGPRLFGHAEFPTVSDTLRLARVRICPFTARGQPTRLAARPCYIERHVGLDILGHDRACPLNTDPRNRKGAST